MTHSQPHIDVVPVGHRASQQWASADHLQGVLDRMDALWLAARQRGLMRLKPTQLSTQVRDVAIAARACGVLPEQFLWIIKETWTALPEVRTAPDPNMVRDQLSGIITLCIHEYYRD